MPSEKETPDTDPATHIERDGTAPVQQTSGDASQEDDLIHLPGFLADEFGVSRSQARMEINSGTITVDGEPYNGDRIDLPRAEVAGKTVEVKGGSTRTFRFQIDPTP
jgi:hypothetical protein